MYFNFFLLYFACSWIFRFPCTHTLTHIHLHKVLRKLFNIFWTLIFLYIYIYVCMYVRVFASAFLKNFHGLYFSPQLMYYLFTTYGLSWCVYWPMFQNPRVILSVCFMFLFFFALFSFILWLTFVFVACAIENKGKNIKWKPKAKTTTHVRIRDGKGSGRIFWYNFVAKGLFKGINMLGTKAYEVHVSKIVCIENSGFAFFVNWDSRIFVSLVFWSKIQNHIVASTQSTSNNL